MIRGFLLVAVGGAALSIASFGIAAVRGPVSWHTDIGNFFLSDDGEEPAGSAISRTLEWKGGDELAFQVPATIIYTQAPSPGITAIGSRRVVEALRLDGNVIDMDDASLRHWHSSRLRIVVTAPQLKSITVESAGDLTLKNVAVDHLSLTVNGAANVVGYGRADALTLRVAGAAHADLSDMALADADISISGAGHVVAGPTGHVSAHISGVGAVELTRQPASISKEINGIGSIEITSPKGTRL
ncbi:DUF2807 domain-containing protein [Nguyenibacter vanlangensis]|uniref:DUF2807 domain-containing protein n=1 Tax=Nguyenibacter vanlangensis TaxID=1216886 RepID=A0A7Y7IV15_9PROT|nr:DUF2807 domain-containing protein [Nguyenibacter vanlangensis]NVN10276.1 DUF2807 domain-containing protein [Nguyenibacter vanlangensis]